MVINTHTLEPLHMRANNHSLPERYRLSTSSESPLHLLWVAVTVTVLYERGS